MTDSSITEPESAALGIAGPKIRASARAADLAVATLCRWEEAGRRPALDRMVDSSVRLNSSLHSSERRWYAQAVFDTVRYLRRQTTVLISLGLPATPDMLVRLFLAAPPIPVEPTEIPSYALPVGASVVADALARLPSPNEPGRYIREVLSFPDGLAASLEEILEPSGALAAAAALNATAQTTLRVNTLRADRPTVLAAMERVEPTSISPWGIRLKARTNLHGHPVFRRGWVEPQDESSQIAVLLTGARAGQMVVEVGAGSGGKSLALAAMMRNRGRLIAIDTDGRRLETLRKRAEHASATNIRYTLPQVDDSGRWEDAGLDHIRGRANTVLVDAPCTGSGVIRRNPDAKWRPVNMLETSTAQLALLVQSSLLVRPGGALIYITCAIEREQNEQVVEQFLDSESGREFQPIPAIERLKKSLRRIAAGSDTPEPNVQSLASGLFIRTWPHLHEMDAGFCACLARVERPRDE